MNSLNWLLWGQHVIYMTERIPLLRLSVPHSLIKITKATGRQFVDLSGVLQVLEVEKLACKIFLLVA